MQTPHSLSLASLSLHFTLSVGRYSVIQVHLSLSLPSPLSLSLSFSYIFVSLIDRYQATSREERVLKPSPGKVSE